MGRKNAGRALALVACVLAAAGVLVTSASADGGMPPITSFGNGTPTVGAGLGSLFGFNGLAVVGSGHHCGGPHAYPTISAGVDAVSPGGIVAVCPGTYTEDVVITKPVTLIGLGATVQPDASDTSPVAQLVGGNDAFTVLASNVTITGFTVQGATADGILVMGDRARIEHVTAQNNTVNGINVDGSSRTTVRGNTITANGGGIELANDPEAAGVSMPGSSGTASYDVISGNKVYGNPAACAIYLVDHAGNGADGIHDNVISGNTVTDNATKGFGAGILLASPVPGGSVYDNTITGNTISGNGLPGVALHSHLPGQNFSGNSVVGNTIGQNNILGLESDDTLTTGVFIGSQDPLDISVAHNTISDDHYGVFTAGQSITVSGGTSNTFTNVDVPFGSAPAFTG